MGEDSSTGLLEGSHTKSGVPIEHLDYRYVKGCKDAKELEKILKVLRSGEEGDYPDLVDFTEKKLMEVNPKSKSLRKELPIRTYNDLNKGEKEEITNDLQQWVENIEQTDKSLKVDDGSVDKLHQNANLPPLRSTTSNQDTHSLQPQQKATVEKSKGSSLPRGYHEWDKFDPDKEIEAMDQKEEKEKRRKQEKTTANNKQGIPSRLNLECKSETEKSVLANREKEKGNEAFQSGQYAEAVTYYSRSIQLNPKAAAAYNNRALAEIKLEQFQQATEDCNTVLSLEPNNVKAYLRRSIARKGRGLHEEAREDLSHVLAVEPNNKRAKELLSEVEKRKRTEQVQNKPVISDDANNGKDQLTENEKTCKNKKGNNLPTETSATTRKGRRLKIVEVEGESEAEALQTLNDESCSVGEGKPLGDESNQLDVDGKATDLRSAVEYSKAAAADQQLQLPGLVEKAKDEATRLFKLGRYAEAAEKYTEAIDILGKDKLTYRSPLCSLLGNRASCLLRIGDCLGCVSDCTAALELAPGSTRPLLKRAEAYETVEKYREALQDYRSVLKIKPQNVAALQGNSRVSRQLERLYGSNWKEKVDPASSRTSSRSSALQDVGAASSTFLLPPQTAYGSPQQPFSGSTETNSILTRVDGSNEAAVSSQHTPPSGGGTDRFVKFSQFKEQGNSLVKQSRFQDAVACYGRCIDIDPNSVAVYTNRALCYLRLDKHELAIEDTTQALRLQPSNVKALFRRALAKKGIGKYDSAARDLVELQKVEPKNAAAKKELEVVLELCRNERRASLDKASEVKKPASKNEVKPPKRKENQPSNEIQWKRIQIEDVQHDEEDDEITDRVPKGPGGVSAEDKASQITPNVNAKTVKLTKNTAYDFFQAWNSVKKNNTKGDADLLRQLEPNSLAHVLSNKLDAPMFNRIVAALTEEILPKGEESLAYDVLKQLCHAQRFDMVLLFLSAKEKNELQHLFSKLEAATLQQNFVATVEFGSLKKKYKL